MMQRSISRCFAMKFKERVPYGVKQTEGYKAAKRAEKEAKKAAVRTRAAASGILVDGRNNLRMSLMQNSGISWFRSLQVLKHLEMHVDAKPEITAKLKNQIAEAVDLVKKGR